jgi:hypothetical protein
MLLPHHQNADQNQDKKFKKNLNKSFENVTQLKYLGMVITNINLSKEEIEWILNSDYGCYHSVQNPLFLGLLPKNIEIRICKSIILPVDLHGCETSMLALREEDV